MVNRIIIIGNGFDLAHELKTKYSDFVKYYYSQIKESSWNDEFYEFLIPCYEFNNCDSIDQIVNHYTKSLGPMSIRHPNLDLHFNGRLGIRIKNRFFYNVSKKIHADWADIENAYFDNLLFTINPDSRLLTKEIEILNMEMNLFCQKFEDYLQKLVNPEIDNKYLVEMAKLFENEFTYNAHSITNFLGEFPESYAKTIRDVMIDRWHGKKLWQKFDDTLILNFNYTDTAERLYNDDFKFLNIHGSLQNTWNPINMGFGDEMNKKYSEIEEKNDNEYLRYVKSFAYSNNSNYHQLFSFIEEKDFQVQIMGHSCGLSDRTLLNSIFEHKNCKSIKTFYHMYKKANNYGEKDNYFDIVRNISRHFNQKISMRNKVVNKNLCLKLPQFPIEEKSV